MKYNSFLYFNMSAIYIVTLLLACTVSCSHMFFFNDSKLYEGTLIPLDPDVCTSQNITFTCTLLSPPNPNNSIGFAVKNESTNKTFLPVDEGRITVINETSSEFTIYNINATTNFYVNCYYWKTFGDVDKTSLLDHTSTVSVYPMPERVGHIDCIVENYIQSMICSWNYGDKYKEDGVNVPDVEFHWRIPNYSGSWNNCPDLNKEKGYCYWNSSRSGDFTLKLINIKLTLKEPCGKNKSSNFIIDTRTIVKPNPVIGLNSLVLNSTCIHVQWRTTFSQMNYPKEHKLTVSNKWDDRQEYKFTTTKTTEQERHGMTLCNLHPYTVYTFTVSIQPTGGQAGFYSDPRETVATTISDIPSASPDVTEGGYSWTQSDCQGVNDRRKVCVFWKPIREADKNGQMKGLDGTFTAVNQTRPLIHVSWAEDLTCSCKSGLLCNTSYVFSVKARNNKGTSKDNSTLLISAATQEILQPQFIVEAANITNVSVSWNEAEKATGYMVAWCRNKNGGCDHRNIVHWQRFSSSSRRAVLQINPENSPQDFLYGVGVFTKQGSSGVEWQDCVYLKNADPKREPQNVVVSAGSDDNTLVVTWDKLTCKSDEPYIAMYNVQYHKLHEGNQQALNVTASGEARVVLKDLEEEQTYVVTVRGITNDGRYGPKSQSQEGVPVDSSLKADAIVGISISVPIVVLMAGIGCVCLIRKGKKKADQTKANLANITIPDSLPFGPDYTEDRPGFDRLSTHSIERQNSYDSGFDPMTPPADKFDRQPKFVDVSVLSNPRVLPNGYCVAALGKDQNPDTDPGSTELHSFQTSFGNTNFVPTEPVVAQVGFVLNGTNRTSSETFVKQVEKDTVINETHVKTRVKNESGDSGVSIAYSKVTLGRLEEKISNDNGQDINENDANRENEIPDYISGDQVFNTSFNVSQITPEASSTTIPTPLAFSECSFGDSIISDQENDNTTDQVSDTNVGSPPDYVKAQSSQDDVSVLFPSNYIATQSPTSNTQFNVGYYQDHFLGQEIQNKRNEGIESKFDQVLTDTSFQPLTNIPCPRSMDDSDNSSFEEETISSPALANASSPVNPQSSTSKTDYIETKNDSSPMTDIQSNTNTLSHHENGQVSCYVTTTDTPNMSFKCAPQQQANSGTGYVTVSNTGTPVTGSPQGIQDQIPYVNPHRRSDHAHVSVSEGQTTKQNSVYPGYVTSVTSPNILHQTQALLSSTPFGSEASSNHTPSNYISESANIKVLSNCSDQTNITLPTAHNDKFPNGVTDNHEAGRYVSHNTVAQVPVPDNSAPSSINADGYLPHLIPAQGLVSPGSATENAINLANVQDNPITIKSNMSDSSIENNFSPVEVEMGVPFPSASKNVDSASNANSSNVLSENNSLPNSTKQTSGYVTNTALCATFSSMASDGNDFNAGYGISTAQETDSKLKDPCTDQSLSSKSGNKVLNNKQPNENVPDNNTSEIDETQRQNSMPTSEMHLPNGYVGHQFISLGNYKEQLGSDNNDQPSVEMKNIEDEDDNGSKRGSDSGLSSLENESPETNRKNIGYVSCEVALYV